MYMTRQLERDIGVMLLNTLQISPCVVLPPQLLEWIIAFFREVVEAWKDVHHDHELSPVFQGLLDVGTERLFKPV